MKIDILLGKAGTFTHEVYRLTKKIPRFEQLDFGSQLRRAALSIPLNITEGYGRKSKKELHHFLLIAYGSYRETKYLLHFGQEEKYFDPKDIHNTTPLMEEVGKLLWTFIKYCE